MVVELGPTTQIQSINIQTVGRLTLGATKLRFLDYGMDCTNNTLGHLILQLEDIRDRTLEPVCPKMRACCSVDKLPGDAHPICRFADATLEHVAHSQLAAYLLNVNGTAFVGEAGVPSDNKQCFEPRQSCDDVLHHTVSKILLLWVSAHVR